MKCSNYENCKNDLPKSQMHLYKKEWICNDCFAEISVCWQEDKYEFFEGLLQDKAKKLILSRIAKTAEFEKTEIIKKPIYHCFICSKKTENADHQYFNVYLEFCGCEMQVMICKNCCNLKCDWCNKQLKDSNDFDYRDFDKSVLCKNCSNDYDSMFDPQVTNEDE